MKQAVKKANTLEIQKGKEYYFLSCVCICICICMVFTKEYKLLRLLWTSTKRLHSSEASFLEFDNLQEARFSVISFEEV